MNNRMSRYPNTFIVGAAKCGTTSISKYLNQHPKIFLPVIKEPHFFSLGVFGNDFQGPGDNTTSEDVPPRLNDYLARFECNDEEILIDGSTSYFPCEGSPELIKQHCPDAKIIIAFRNPARRSFSAFCHMVRAQRETVVNFEQALKKEAERIERNYIYMWRYRDISNYCDKVERYLDTFDRENVHFLLLEQFLQRPAEELKRLCRFLEVDDTFAFDTSRQYNKSSVLKKNAIMRAVWSENKILKGIKKVLPRGIKDRIIEKQTYRLELNPETYRKLTAEFQPMLDNLEKMIGLSLDALRI